MDPRFRKPVIHEQQVLTPPPMVAIDLRIWATSGGQFSQRSIKVWCPDTDELLAMSVELERPDVPMREHVKWLQHALGALWHSYVNPDPFGP